MRLSWFTIQINDLIILDTEIFQTSFQVSEIFWSLWIQFISWYALATLNIPVLFPFQLQTSFPFSRLGGVKANMSFRIFAGSKSLVLLVSHTYLAYTRSQLFDFGDHLLHQFSTGPVWFLTLPNNQSTHLYSLYFHWKNFDFYQIYVYDIIFGSTNESLCREFASLMHENFEMPIMRELTYFLGL